MEVGAGRHETSPNTVLDSPSPTLLTPPPHPPPQLTLLLEVGAGRHEAGPDAVGERVPLGDEPLRRLGREEGVRPARRRRRQHLHRRVQPARHERAAEVRVTRSRSCDQGQVTKATWSRSCRQCLTAKTRDQRQTSCQDDVKIVDWAAGASRKRQREDFHCSG